MDGQLSRSVQLYDELMQGPLAAYLSLSAQIGDVVKTQADMVQSAVTAQRQFLVVVSMTRPPSQDVLISMLKPTSDQIQAIQAYREKNRTSSFFNHLSAISESITGLGWVTVSPTPAPFVKEMTDASQFYANKVLTAYKDKDKKHVDWAKSWVQFLSELQKYVKSEHTTGLVWNPQGGLANSASAAGGPPPPPPPPPMSLFSEASAPGGGDETRLALMRELNMGTDITSSLKKVTADQQTHKNPNLRSQQPVKPSGGGSAHVAQKAPGSAPMKPPKFELEGRKWLIEFQNGRQDLVVQSQEMSQSVNLYRCTDCVVTVKGKLNSIIVDSCSKVAVVFDNIVSCVEFVNCQNVQAQSMGTVPTVNIEKTDVAQIYLSKESVNAEIVTAKASSVNVNVPLGDGDYAEHAIPEQFKSLWTGKGFATKPTDI